MISVPAVLNLARYNLIEETPESAKEVFDLICSVMDSVPGHEEPTLWRRVTGEDVMVLTLFENAAHAAEYQKQLVMSNAYERLSKLIEETPDVDRFEVTHHQGVSPHGAPVESYCSTNSYLSDPGLEQSELAEAKYVLDSLWQINGFIGAYVGKSLIGPSVLNSVAFWEDAEAAEKAIPIRVNTNLRMYRRWY